MEFIRFNRDGSTDKRKFFVSGGNPAGSYKNPILMAGDVVRVNDSPLSATVTLLNEITAPAVGVYSAYSEQKFMMTTTPAEKLLAVRSATDEIDPLG